MQNNNQLSKTLIQLNLSDLTIDPQYVFHTKQGEENTRALELSLKEDGYHGVMTTFKKDGKHIIINGNRCYPILLDLHGPDFKVYVWVLDGEPTEDQIKLHILALGKVRKKLKRDILNENEVWEKVIPSNQGQKEVDKKKIETIAQRIGISVSLLNKLKRINKADPDLIRQLDVGDTDLKKAEARAKHLEKEAAKKKLQESNETGVPSPTSAESEPDETAPVKYKDVDVPLEDLPTCCPTCNRQFSTITPEEIPSIFNVGRQEKNNQLTWMQKTA